MSALPPLIEKFQTQFKRMEPNMVLNLDDLYDPNVRFEDPLHKVEGRAALLEYFNKLNSQLEYADFEFGVPVCSENAAAVPWVMTMALKKPKQVISIPGISHLTFAERILTQRDYFDVGASLYEKLPIMGPLLRWIKKKVT